MRALGFPAKKADVQRRLAAYDQQNSGCITLQQFQLLMSELMLDKDPAEKIPTAFRLFDTQNTGKISPQDLQIIAKELGQEIDHQDLLGMIVEFDLDKDGYINAEEFHRIMSMVET